MNIICLNWVFHTYCKLLCPLADQRNKKAQANVLAYLKPVQFPCRMGFILFLQLISVAATKNLVFVVFLPTGIAPEGLQHFPYNKMTQSDAFLIKHVQ